MWDWYMCRIVERKEQIDKGSEGIFQFFATTNLSAYFLAS